MGPSNIVKQWYIFNPSEGYGPERVLFLFAKHHVEAIQYVELDLDNAWVWTGMNANTLVSAVQNWFVCDHKKAKEIIGKNKLSHEYFEDETILVIYLAENPEGIVVGFTTSGEIAGSIPNKPTKTPIKDAKTSSGQWNWYIYKPVDALAPYDVCFIHASDFYQAQAYIKEKQHNEFTISSHPFLWLIDAAQFWFDCDADKAASILNDKEMTDDLVLVVDLEVKEPSPTLKALKPTHWHWYTYKPAGTIVAYDVCFIHAYDLTQAQQYVNNKYSADFILSGVDHDTLVDAVQHWFKCDAGKAGLIIQNQQLNFHNPGEHIKVVDLETEPHKKLQPKNPDYYWSAFKPGDDKTKEIGQLAIVKTPSDAEAIEYVHTHSPYKWYHTGEWSFLKETLIAASLNITLEKSKMLLDLGEEVGGPLTVYTFDLEHQSDNKTKRLKWYGFKPNNGFKLGKLAVIQAYSKDEAVNIVQHNFATSWVFNGHFYTQLIGVIAASLGITNAQADKELAFNHQDKHGELEKTIYVIRHTDTEDPVYLAPPEEGFSWTQVLL